MEVFRFLTLHNKGILLVVLSVVVAYAMQPKRLRHVYLAISPSDLQGVTVLMTDMFNEQYRSMFESEQMCGSCRDDLGKPTLDESTGSSGGSRNLCENAPQVGQGRKAACCSDSRQSSTHRHG